MKYSWLQSRCLNQAQPIKPPESSISIMSPMAENLISKNEAYASTFSDGHLALPPAKNYAVCTSPHHPSSSLLYEPQSIKPNSQSQ